MATAYTDRVPAWFWIVSVLALLWEAMGCYSYVAQVTMSASDIAALPEGQQTLMAAIPTWLNGVFAIATWSGLAAAVCLLLRRTWARPLFLVSLVAVLIQFSWWFFVARAADVIGTDAYVMPVAVIVAAVLLVWFSSMAAKRGWLR
jgi:MFS superfamily sulfate permease-like transporter